MKLSGSEPERQQTRIERDGYHPAVESGMHQYRIQYQSFLNVMTLKEAVAHDENNRNIFVANLVRNGYWLDDKTWIAPGCIQQVLVIS